MAQWGETGEMNPKGAIARAAGRDMGPSVTDFTEDELRQKQQVGDMADVGDMLSNLLPMKAGAGAIGTVIRGGMSNPAWFKQLLEKALMQKTPGSAELLNRLRHIEQSGGKNLHEVVTELPLEGGRSGRGRGLDTEQAFNLYKNLQREMMRSPTGAAEALNLPQRTLPGMGVNADDVAELLMETAGGGKTPYKR